MSGGVVISVVSALGDWVYDRFEPRPLAIPGAVIWISCIWILSTLDESSGVWAYLAAYLALSAAQAMMWAPIAAPRWRDCPCSDDAYLITASPGLQDVLVCRWATAGHHDRDRDGRSTTGITIAAPEVSSSGESVLKSVTERPAPDSDHSQTASAIHTFRFLVGGRDLCR